MNPYTYKISLRVSHPSQSIEVIEGDIANTTHFHFVNSWNIGNARLAQDGGPLVGVHTDSYCCFAHSKEKIYSSDKALSEELLLLVGELEPLKGSLLRHVDSGGALLVSVGIFLEGNSGEVIEYDIIKKMASLGLGLSIDIYP